LNKKSKLVISFFNDFILVKEPARRKFFIYLFLRCGYSALSERLAKAQQICGESPVFGILLNRFFCSFGFIVHPFIIAPSFVCLHAILERFSIAFPMFVNVLASLNIAFGKYLVFSVSVWFHCKLIVGGGTEGSLRREDTGVEPSERHLWAPTALLV
jgi:hypothetical protein